MMFCVTIVTTFLFNKHYILTVKNRKRLNYADFNQNINTIHVI
jgi:hypothetical protein